MKAMPTPTQVRVLRALAAGAKLYTMKGLEFRAWLFGPGFSHTAVLPSTVFRMENEKWIEVVKEDWRGANYQITQAGRSVFKQATTHGRGER